jgi:hypothetical protein
MSCNLLTIQHTFARTNKRKKEQEGMKEMNEKCEQKEK